MICHAKFSIRGTLSTKITGWCVAILAGICVALAYICCTSSSEGHITLRKFPYPYKAGLAICSDLDYTDSFDKFIAIQDFLCDTRSTELGPGLGLEIGNTFWFYNQFAGTDTLAGDAEDLPYSVEGDWFNRGKGISLFDGVTEHLTDYAPGLLKLIQAGFIDCLHSYGDFADSGFNRELARRATQLLGRHGLQIHTFVNHGDTDNQNNMGEAPWFLGDNPDSRFYHADISCDAGIKYLWRGHVTHCLGQGGRRSIVNSMKAVYEWLTDIRYSAQDYPNDNELIHPYQLDDGQMIFEFVRYINPWGKHSVSHQEYVAHQLGPEQVDRLIENQGYLIFYTHLGTSCCPPYLSDSTVAALRHIRARVAGGDLLVATTTRLLDYHVRRHSVHWHIEPQGNATRIVIDSLANVVEGSYQPEPNALMGLTFYIPDDRVVELMVQGEPVDIVLNPPDHTGRKSISIPWIPLEYPRVAIPNGEGNHR